METKAFQRIYTQLMGITKATVTLKAQGIANEE
jgi:V/A-type H+-transporting ATPase subunit B